MKDFANRRCFACGCFFLGGQLLFVDRRLSLCYAFCGIVYILTDKKKSINQRKRKEYAMRNIKKWIVFALILTFLILLPACASSSLLTAEEVAALEEQVADELDYQAPLQLEMKFTWFRYYGTENGYHIISYRSGYDNTADMWNRDVAGYSFDGGGNAQLVAYRKGEFIDLKEAYEKGIISQKAIAKAAELHAANKNATDE